MTLGRYPIITLAQAREKARQLLAHRTLHGDRPPALTFEEALTLFLRVHCAEHNSPPQTADTYTSLLGETPAHLLGAFLVTAFFQAAASRPKREDFTLYVDEFQNFATETFSTILSEARKFRLNLVVAHQFLGQLPDSLRQAVIGNAGNAHRVSDRG